MCVLKFWWKFGGEDHGQWRYYLGRRTALPCMKSFEEHIISENIIYISVTSTER